MSSFVAPMHVFDLPLGNSGSVFMTIGKEWLLLGRAGWRSSHQWVGLTRPLWHLSSSHTSRRDKLPLNFRSRLMGFWSIDTCCHKQRLLQRNADMKDEPLSKWIQVVKEGRQLMCWESVSNKCHELQELQVWRNRLNPQEPARAFCLMAVILLVSQIAQSRTLLSLNSGHSPGFKKICVLWR